ncbi:MAG: single-stranded DNA-binding protein [Proteobacteria bacterium]|nr:single-stranded DNA-binding protein [Pseudomonadota bacterium]
MDFSKLKKSSSNLDKLSKALETINTSSDSNSDDDRYWKPELDKSGNGYAVIRFLPEPPQDEDGLPWVKMFRHGFQGPGGWLIDDCRTTLNDKCPVCEHNTQLWNSGIEANKKIARDQKRKLTYISNIYVVEDPKHPENNGKVFLFKYGKSIFDKINGAMHPEFEDEKPMNPFDLWKGANFKVKIRKVDGYQNYDKCEFDSPAALLDDDDALEKVWKQEYSLKELIDPSKFKSYDAVKARLDKVLGLGGTVAPKTTVEDASPPWDAEEKTTKEKFVPKTSPDLDDDDDMSYFAKLAAED